MGSRTTISTIRHAETQYNFEQRYAGSLDISLNDRGISTCKRASEKLTELEFAVDVVISSTLRRTAETARLLLGEDAPVVKSKLCVERNYVFLKA